MNPTICEKPFASYNAQFTSRPGIYVPIAVINETPDWVLDVAPERHGDHETIEGDQSDCWCVVLVRGRETDRWSIPPGDWLIYYRYNHDDGTHDHRLCVAAKIAA
jgi:hypothetical protein